MTDLLGDKRRSDCLSTDMKRFGLRDSSSIDSRRFYLVGIFCHVDLSDGYSRGVDLNVGRFLSSGRVTYIKRNDIVLLGSEARARNKEGQLIIIIIQVALEWPETARADACELSKRDDAAPFIVTTPVLLTVVKQAPSRPLITILTLQEAAIFAFTANVIVNVFIAARNGEFCTISAFSKVTFSTVTGHKKLFAGRPIVTFFILMPVITAVGGPVGTSGSF